MQLYCNTICVVCFTQVTELKGQLSQVARSNSATSSNILIRSAMMSPSAAPSQYDEKHRSVLKKIEKDRKEAQEVRESIFTLIARLLLRNSNGNKIPLF